MRIQQILETTTAGSVATVAQPLMTQTREDTNVRGLKPVQQVMKGAKKKGPYANSIVEGKVKELISDLKNLTSHDFEKKHKQSKAEVRADMKKVNEDDLSEQDLIVIPGQGRLRGTGFTKHDPDRAEHEGETLKNSLHTIIRVATHLDKRLSTSSEFPEWVSEKIGAVKSNMVTVMDYLISSQEMQHDTDAMEGSENKYSNLSNRGVNRGINRAADDFDRMLDLDQAESPHYKTQHQQDTKQRLKTKPMTGPKGVLPEGSQRVDSLVTDALRVMKGPEVSDAVLALKRVLGDRAYNERRGFYSFYVDQIVDMYGQQGVAEGVDIGQEWMSDTELDQYVPQQLQQQWRDLLGYDRNGNPSALWSNLTGGYEPDVNDPQHRALMVKVANKWFAAKKIPNVKFFNVKDADDELEWLVQIGKQGVAEGSRIPTLNQLLKTSSPSPKDTYYIVQGSVADEEGRDVTVFNIYYNDKSVFGPYYNPKSATRKLHQLRADGHEVIGERVEQGVAEGEKDTSRMNQQHQDFYNKNPNFKRDDREVKSVGGRLATKVTPKTAQVTKKPMTPFEGKIDFAKKLQGKVDKHNKAVVKTKQAVGSRVADIGAGGKEHNVKTDAAWDAAKKKVSEGAKVDRMVKHVKQSEKKLGHSDKESENIAWATANKRGMLDNKNKKK